MKRKADRHVGEWRPKPHASRSLKSAHATVKPTGTNTSESMPTHTLFQSYDQFLTSGSGVYDDATLKGMWAKAANLVSTPNMILPIPGKAGSRSRMVASETGKAPHACGHSFTNKWQQVHMRFILSKVRIIQILQPHHCCSRSEQIPGRIYEHTSQRKVTCKPVSNGVPRPVNRCWGKGWKNN